MERNDPRPGSSRILSPVEVPFVIAVTGEEGGQYTDDGFWDANGVLHYYGAGQVGGME